jgi:hypothetical protein
MAPLVYVIFQYRGGRFAYLDAIITGESITSRYFELTIGKQFLTCSFRRCSSQCCSFMLAEVHVSLQLAENVYYHPLAWYSHGHSK